MPSSPAPLRDPGIDYASLRTVAYLCFFFSGATGLVYEVVWTRMLILVFGATTFAVSTVLTAFMAGLALGGFAAGRWADRQSRPVLVYGVLELLIGLYALCVPALFSSLTPLYKVIWQRFAPQFYLFSLVRFAAVSAVLLVPTFLMGATLPVLGRFCARTRHLIGADVGALYATNTAGAVLGTFVTGFVLIPLIGVKSSILIAATINVIIGLLAIGLGRGVSMRVTSEDDEAAPAGPEPRPGTAVSVAVLIAFALSGFAAMGYEVAWSRTLSLIIGSSVYAFTIMLTTFLLGLALGGMVGARLPDSLTRHSPLVIAVVQMLVAATVFGVVWCFGQMPYWFTVLFKAFGQRGHWQLMALEFFMAAAVMFVPTLLLGMMFPLAVRVCAPSVKRLGRSVGAVYATNTLGAILGSFLAGWVLIPSIGIQNTILACACVSLVAGLLVLAFSRGPATVLAPVTIVGIGLLAAIWRYAPEWDALVMSSGMYKYAEDMGDGPVTRKRFHYFVRGEYDLLDYKEGLTTTVTVAQHRFKGNKWMATNGKIDASSGPDMPTQLLSGHLPLLLARDPKDVLVVGFASGVTVGATTAHPVDKVVAVEIEEAVVECSKHFNDVNRDPLSDPRVELVIDDARNHLLVAERQFDVIISEPSNPWITGASNLFTREFFQIAKARLRKGGIYTQWLQLYGMATDDLRSLLATLGSVYKHVLVFETIEDTDLILVASDAALVIDVERVAERLRGTPAGRDLARVEVDGVPRLLSYFLMGTREVRDLAGDAPLNTDDNGLIEFSSPKHLHDDTQTANSEALSAVADTVLPYLARHGATRDEQAQLLARIALACHERKLTARAQRLATIASLMSRSPAVQEILDRIAESPDADTGEEE